VLTVLGRFLTVAIFPGPIFHPTDFDPVGVEKEFERIDGLSITRTADMEREVPGTQYISRCTSRLGGSASLRAAT
jgi:hypothetical protein